MGAQLDVSKVPILPIASRESRFQSEIPPNLRALNCLFYKEHGPERVFGAVLETLGLLPRQRRVFLSYRRSESTGIALQLFAELSARNFQVFLDTHSIGAGADFQETLWHELCDVDVLVMLDTPSYFASRWTAAEYGRALAKGIGVLRISWPDATPNTRTGTSSRVELINDDFTSNEELAPGAIERICSQLESFRSLAHATRHLGVVTSIVDSVRLVGGKVESVGGTHGLQIRLPTGKRVYVQPTVGVPTAVTLQRAVEAAGDDSSAVVYDHIGLMRTWQQHIDWLGTNVPGAKWIKVTEAPWEFAGLET